jgi:hypothetical protein
MTRAVLGRYFYFAIAFVIVAVVVYGFSFTVDDNLIHPAIPRPRILYVHATLFSGWLVFYILQSALVRTRNVRWHRRIGWFGVALGSMIPVLGVSTAIVMGRFDIESLHQTDIEPTLVIPLFDMVCFSSAFAAAVVSRRKPELHRRLMFVATCALTAAGWGRFPSSILPHYLFYGGVDLLIVLGVARDLIVDRRIHPVYVWVLPPFMLGQALVTYTALHAVGPWLTIAHAILG